MAQARRDDNGVPTLIGESALGITPINVYVDPTSHRLYTDASITDGIPPGFNIPEYDSIELTYVAAGNGVGEIETVVYKYDGNTVATINLTYNASNEITSITKT
jgi:hypothetical protein